MHNTITISKRNPIKAKLRGQQLVRIPRIFRRKNLPNCSESKVVNIAYWTNVCTNVFWHLTIRLILKSLDKLHFWELLTKYDLTFFPKAKIKAMFLFLKIIEILVPKKVHITYSKSSSSILSNISNSTSCSSSTLFISSSMVSYQKWCGFEACFFVQQKKVIFWSLNTKWQLGHFESWDYYYTAAAPCVSVRRKVPCDLKKIAVPSIDELNQVFSH